jgi:hypothetical protein
MTKKQKALILTGIGSATIVILVVTIVFVRASHSSTPKHAISSTSTPSPTPSPTTTPTALPNIWQTASSVNYGKGITFSMSQPLTGYVCGNTTNMPNSPPNLELGKTSDGGFTWSAPITTSVPGNNCALAINPYNINDIVMTSYSCWEGCGDDNGMPYRSVDGGKTWTKLVLPSGNEASYMTKPVAPVWTPNALFVTVTYPGTMGGDLPAPAHHIAVSINAGPLAWTSQEPNFGLNMPASSVYSISIFTSGKAINAYNAMGTPLQGFLSTSTDNGMTWTPATITGSIPTYLNSTSNEQDLYGSLSNDKCVKSTDGGKTWINLPDAPQGYSSTGMFSLAANDGTLFLSFVKVGDISIYKLLPNATTWTHVTSISTDQSTDRRISAVSSNKNNRPMLIWSTSVHQNGSNSSIIFSPVLEYHPV